MIEPSKSLFDRYEVHYNRQSQGYFRSLKDVLELHLDRLPRWLDRIDKSSRILDAGCANGYLLSLLHASGYFDLTGIDLAEGLAEQARASLPDEVPIHVTDVREFLAQTADAAYDVIIFHHVLEHIPREDTVELLKEMRRCLKKGGHLSIRTPNAACLMASYHCFGDYTHVTWFNEMSLTQVLDLAGYDIGTLEFEARKPRLFWPWRHPVRAGLRLVSLLRWMIRNIIHRSAFLLMEIGPAPKTYDIQLEALISK